MKIVASAAGLLLAIAMVSNVPTVNAASSDTAPKKFEKAVSKFEDRITDRIAELQALKESGAGVQTRLDLADEYLTKADGAMLQAETDVVYIYVAGAQEKRVLRSLLLGLDGKVRQRLEHVEAINTALDAGEINADTAEDLLSVDIDAISDDLETYKATFRENTLEFMKLKAEAAKTYLGDSLDYADMTVSAYKEMETDGVEVLNEDGTQFDTAAVETLIADSQTFYDDANTLYDDSKDGEDDEDLRNMQKAMVKYIRSRQKLSHAQIRLKEMDVQWDSARTADCDIYADETEGEATDDPLCSTL